MTKSNHKVPVVRITELLPHPNADSLSIVQIGGYQCVVKTDNYRVGDLAIYVQPDSVVPELPQFKFLWEPRTFDGPVPEKYRRVTVRRFRKEWSEGLLLPLSDFSGGLVHEPKLSYGWIKEGDDVSESLGITHYEPPEPQEVGTVRKQQYKWPPKSFKGWVYYLLHLVGIDLNGSVGGANEKGPSNPPPVYDVEAMKNFMDAFEPGELVVVTEKIHGSNARFLFDGKKMFAGSRKLWKSAKSKCVWREALKQNPWIEEWCKAHPGHTLYGEVTPTQGDKFLYGSVNGQVKFHAFDILTPEETWKKPFTFTDGFAWSVEQGIGQTVPVLGRVSFDPNTLKSLVDGASHVEGAKNIREGIVVSPQTERHVHGLGRLQLKLVSNAFLGIEAD